MAHHKMPISYSYDTPGGSGALYFIWQYGLFFTPHAIQLLSLTIVSLLGLLSALGT